MPQCLVIEAGTGVVVASAADPCTGLLALTPAEYGSLSASPFLLTPEQGALVATAVGAIWGAAYAWKALGRALNTDGEKD